MITRPKKRLFGYSRRQTDQLIKEIKKDYEDELKKKRDRIVELTETNRQFKDELEHLADTLEEFRDKERYISHAMLHAEERAQLIVDEATEKVKKETEEIKIAREEWNERQKQIKQKVLYMNKTFAELVESFRTQINTIEKEKINAFPKKKDKTTISA